MSQPQDLETYLSNLLAEAEALIRDVRRRVEQGVRDSSNGQNRSSPQKPPAPAGPGGKGGTAARRQASRSRTSAWTGPRSLPGPRRPWSSYQPAAWVALTSLLLAGIALLRSC